MSNHRIAPRERFQQSAERGPNGRRLCRGCKAEVPKGKRSWCSRPCEEEFLILTIPSYVRNKVWQRDGGICAACGRDCKALEQQIREMGYNQWVRTTEQRTNAQQRLRELKVQLRAEGFNGGGHTWEADHIIPVAEGGGECGLDNYRTLCIPCHKAATAALRKRLAKPKPAPPPKPPSLFDSAVPSPLSATAVE